ncbi:hypothetical protein BD309DRAFT_956803 [Dichomitus squalens]|nr:hypothetical protein BD309DRAFT_956803 [Dichomitus squalens]
MDTNARRRTTVHDVAALRIHRDGTRVANSDTNRRSRRAKYTVRDARGNWIAKDAGGLGTVTSRPGASKEDDGQDEDASEVEADELLQEELRPSQRKDKGKGRAIDDEGDIAVNTRAGKRSRFDEDFSFLNPGAEPALLPSQTGEPLHPHPEGRAFKTIPVPSSDLLKCLHYFASAYYTAMGQLYDAGRESRKERKMRRAQRLKATAIASSSRPRSEPKSAEYSEDSSAAEDIEFTEDEQDIEEPAEEDGGDDRTDGEGKEGVERGNPKNKRPKTRRPMEKDMYKLFDGSALMALGMLLQEHVAESLESNIPEGWEREMALVARERKLEKKRAWKAQDMRKRRRPAEIEAPGLPDLQSEDEDGEAETLLEEDESEAEEEQDGNDEKSCFLIK